VMTHRQMFTRPLHQKRQ
jgi:uncharacterized coiled-coil protein SlyX